MVNFLIGCEPSDDGRKRDEVEEISGYLVGASKDFFLHRRHESMVTLRVALTLKRSDNQVFCGIIFPDRPTLNCRKGRYVLVHGSLFQNMAPARLVPVPRIE